MEKDSKNLYAGTRVNHEGHYVPERLIKTIDLMRDDLVQNLVARANIYQVHLARLKASFFGEIDDLVALSAAEYKVEIGGAKGNLTLMSFDGLKKVVRSVQDKMSFDQRLEAAKALIDNCLARWSEGARPELVVLVQNAFKTDKQGKINTGRVLELRGYKIDDPEWILAMEAIADALTVVGSASYVRFYERAALDGKWEAISLDMSALTPVRGGMAIDLAASKLWLALSAIMGPTDKPGLIALKEEFFKMEKSVNQILSLDVIEVLLDTIDVPGIQSEAK